MTCPNANGKIDGRCAGRGWVIHRGQPVPCRSCWQAADNPPLTGLQNAQLRRYHLLLDALADQTLFTDEDVCRAFDDCCTRLRDLGVTDDVRDAWVWWLRRLDAEVPA